MNIAGLVDTSSHALEDIWSKQRSAEMCDPWGQFFGGWWGSKSVGNLQKCWFKHPEIGNKRTLRVCFSIFCRFLKGLSLYRWSAIFCCQSMVISGHQCQIDLSTLFDGDAWTISHVFSDPFHGNKVSTPQHWIMEYYGIICTRPKTKSVSSLVNTAAHHFCWAKSVKTSPPCPEPGNQQRWQ